MRVEPLSDIVRKRSQKLFEGVGLHEPHRGLYRGEHFDNQVEHISKEPHVFLRGTYKQHKSHVVASPRNRGVIVDHGNKRALGIMNNTSQFI